MFKDRLGVYFAVKVSTSRPVKGAFSMRELFRDAMLVLGVTFAGIQAFYIWRGSDPAARAPAALNHPIGGLAVVAVLFIIAGVLNAAPLLRRLIRRQGTEDQTKPDSLLLPEKTWADVMADDDAAKIQERVCQISQRKEFHFDPISDPYIDIITELFNGSVFDLVSVGETSGHGVYAGSQLAADPRVLSSVEPMMVRIKHGERVILTVRQFLSSGVADTMVANLNRGVVADFEGVSVSFKMRSPTGPSQTYRWWGPRFTMDEAPRV